MQAIIPVFMADVLPNRIVLKILYR